jgi:hypothetical protein
MMAENRSKGERLEGSNQGGTELGPEKGPVLAPTLFLATQSFDSRNSKSCSLKQELPIGKVNAMVDRHHLMKTISPDTVVCKITFRFARARRILSTGQLDPDADIIYINTHV